MGSFVIKEVRIKELGQGYYFDLYAPSRLIIATSQIYTSLAVCKKGARSVVRDAREAAVDDLTDPTRPSVGYPRFEIFREGENYRFRLRTQSGDRTLTSQYYSSVAICKAAIESVKALVAMPKFYILEGHELRELLNVNISHDEDVISEVSDTADIQLSTERPLVRDVSAEEAETRPEPENAEDPTESYGF